MTRLLHGVTILTAIVLIGADEASHEPELKPGSSVLVTEEGAKLMFGTKVRAELTKGTKLDVISVKGNWIGATAEVDGKKLTGWVRTSQVTLPASSSKRKTSGGASPGRAVAAASATGVAPKAKLVISPQFDEARPFKDGLAIVGRTVDYGSFSITKWGCINAKGKVVIPIVYERLRPFNEGLAPAVAPVESGYVVSVFLERSGKTAFALPRKGWSSGGHEFSGGLAMVQRHSEHGSGTKCGFVDKTGKVIIQPLFDLAWTFRDGLALVRLGEAADGKYGFIDRSGKYVVKPTFERLSEFSDGLALAGSSGKLGYIDRSGKFVIEPLYQNAGEFGEGLAPVVKPNSEWGFIDKSGAYVIKPQFAGARSFKGGLAAVKSGANSKWGLVNKAGKIVTTPEFDDIDWEFHDGLARVYTGGASIGWYRQGDTTPTRYGFVDSTGKVVVPLVFEKAGPFSEGLAAVRTVDRVKFGYIDRSGKMVIVPTYDGAGDFSEGMAAVKVGKKWGYIAK